MTPSDEELIRRMHHELIDSYDEELELELEDQAMDALTGSGSPARTEEHKELRRQYFRDLLRLQVNLPSQQSAMIIANPDYAAGNGPVLAGSPMKTLLSKEIC